MALSDKAQYNKFVQNEVKILLDTTGMPRKEALNQVIKQYPFKSNTWRTQNNKALAPFKKVGKFAKLGRGLNMLMWAWMAYDVLKMTGALGADTEADASTMAGMEGINIRRDSMRRRESQQRSEMARQLGTMNRAVSLGQAGERARGYLGGELDSQLDEYLATKGATLGAASLMNPVAQNNIAHLSNTGIL